jgi:hypothetical protein
VSTVVDWKCVGTGALRQPNQWHCVGTVAIGKRTETGVIVGPKCPVVIIDRPSYRTRIQGDLLRCHKRSAIIPSSWTRIWWTVRTPERWWWTPEIVKQFLMSSLTISLSRRCKWKTSSSSSAVSTPLVQQPLFSISGRTHRHRFVLPT